MAAYQPEPVCVEQMWGSKLKALLSQKVSRFQESKVGYIYASV